MTPSIPSEGCWRITLGSTTWPLVRREVAAAGPYTPADAGRPGEAAPEERRLPRDRGDGRPASARSTGRPTARCACSCTTRSTTSGRTRRPCRRRSSRSRWACSASSGTRPSRWTPCSSTTSRGAPLPPRAVLLTFDDGYRDNLENALPILRRHGYPAVLFVPIGFLDDAPAAPARGVAAPARGPERDRRLGRARRARGGRDPHRVARDRPPAAVRARAGGGDARDRALEAAARGAARARGRGVRVRQGLARRLPARAREPRPAGRVPARVHLGLGRQRPGTDRFRLRRYNVEPYPARTFELVLSGRVRPDRGQGHGGGHARPPRVQRRARHGDALSGRQFELEPYDPSRRDDYLGLLGEAWGGGRDGRRDVRLVVRREPGREHAVGRGARRGGRRRGRAQPLPLRRRRARAAGAVLGARGDRAERARARHLPGARAPARGAGQRLGLGLRARVREPADAGRSSSGRSAGRRSTGARLGEAVPARAAAGRGRSSGSASGTRLSRPPRRPGSATTSSATAAT